MFGAFQPGRGTDNRFKLLCLDSFQNFPRNSNGYNFFQGSDSYGSGNGFAPFGTRRAARSLEPYKQGGKPSMPAFYVQSPVKNTLFRVRFLSLPGQNPLLKRQMMIFILAAIRF
jgi:hypothetical protein